MVNSGIPDGYLAFPALPCPECSREFTFDPGFEQLLLECRSGHFAVAQDVVDHHFPTPDQATPNVLIIWDRREKRLIELAQGIFRRGNSLLGVELQVLALQLQSRLIELHRGVLADQVLSLAID